MTGGKLILICQSGGEFLEKDDESLSYKGGEAHAININHDTVFDDLKLKLAEMLNLEYKSMSVKYFIPGNRRTLITLSNDRDLKMMCRFHEDSVTVDIFVMGKEGFDREASNLHHSRACGIKLAETVTASPGFPAAGVATNTSINATTHAVSAAAAADPTMTPAVSVMAVSPTAQSPSGMVFASELSLADTASDDNGAAACLTLTKPASTPNNSTIEMDMNATPADTVKKRRRIASWKVGPNGPTIVTLAENIEDMRKNLLHEKNMNSNAASTVDDMDQLPTVVSWIDNPNYSHNISDSHDAPLEKVVASWKDGITDVGQDFKSVKEFRDALQKYAIAHRFVYRLKKNDTNRASGRCVDENCSWRIHASWVPSAHVFRIKKMNKSHTCGGESWKAAHPPKNWLVNIIKERLSENPHHKPKEIASGISKDFGIELNYTQVWRGIEDARKQLQGPRKEAYNQLPWLCGKILEANPGSSVNLCIGDDGKFQRLFVSFNAAIHGFQHGCRPLLYLDSVSLKSKYHEMLLTATALDGNENTFPVAFAIVDIENEDNWHWFLEQLRSAVTTTRSITFVSDKEKGLMKSVLEIFDNAHYGYSIYHLLENFRKNLRGPFHGDGKGSLIGNFLAAAHAVRLDGFKISTKQIERVSSKAYDWIMQIEPEYWTNALFKGEYYNEVLVDVAESYFNWIEEAKDLPIIQKLEVLGCKMMELINTRRMGSSGWSTKLTPSKEEKLQEEVLKARDLKVFVSSSTLFEIHGDSINVVDTGKGECSCLKWKVTGLPCCHAIAAFNSTGKCTYDYCSLYFTVDSFRATYSESINAVLADFDSMSEEKTASEAGQVLPPSTPRPPTRETKRQGKTPGSAKRTVSCSRCQGEGHNKATCKEVF